MSIHLPQAMRQTQHLSRIQAQATGATTNGKAPINNNASRLSIFHPAIGEKTLTALTAAQPPAGPRDAAHNVAYNAHMHHPRTAHEPVANIASTSA